MPSDMKLFVFESPLMKLHFPALLILLLIMPFTLIAKPVGHFTMVVGQIDLLKSGTEQAEPVQKNQAVELGDIVRSKSHSKAQITLTDQTVLSIAENSRLQINGFRFPEEERQKKSLIRMFRGKLRSAVHAQAGGQTHFEVTTPTAVAAIRGTDFFTIVHSSVLSEIIVKQGRVGVRNILATERDFQLLVPNEGAHIAKGKEPVKRRVSATEIEFLMRETDPDVTIFPASGDHVDAFIPTPLSTPPKTPNLDPDNTKQPIITALPPVTRPITATAPALLGTPLTINIAF